MSKRVRNILIAIFLVLVIGLSSYYVLKINKFNFKTFRFSNVDKPKEDISNEGGTHEGELPDDFEAMLPDDDDVLPSGDDYLPSDNEENPSGTTTTPSTGTNTAKTTTSKITTSKNTTTTKKADTSSSNTNMPNVSTVKFDADINSVKLNPMLTRKTDLDNKIGNIINSITNSSMTNNQKLYAIFRYIIDHSEYGNGIILGNEVYSLIDKYHYRKLDATIVYNAQKILDSGYGVCDDYAALFVVMARRLGFEAYWLGGSVKKAGGGTTPHAWANILVNGTYYVFDAQIADKRPEQEKYYYGKTDKEVTIYTYNDRNYYVNTFNKFKEIEPLKLQVNLSGAVNDSKTVTSYINNIIKNVEYNAYVGETINININMTGASKYKYNISVKPENSSQISLYSKENDLNSKLNLSYKFDSAQRYTVYISVWNGDTGIIAENYFTVNVKSDDRINDIDVTVNKEVETSDEDDEEVTYVIFDSKVVKNSSSSTCTPNYNYTLVETDDPIKRTINDNKMYYELGYIYKVKVTATCGSGTYEKIIEVK